MHIKLVQVRDANGQRRIALVDGPELRLLRKEYDSVFRFASRVIEGGEPVTDLIEMSLTGDKLLYDDVYYGKDAWVLLPCFDHPDNPLHCMVTGTGLTHKASAEKMNQKHYTVGSEAVTENIAFYEWGAEGGKPSGGGPGVQPEWFYKGNGTVLKAHGEALHVPFYTDDRGGQAEIAGLYLVNGEGQPIRIGFCQCNEFADHGMESKNHRYLAHTKLRSCAIGPELVMDSHFADVSGRVSIVRGHEVVWERDLQSGEKQLVHGHENIEFHHFKYAQHRVPGQVHIHLFGTGATSYGAQISLADADIVRIAFVGFGRPLENVVQFDKNITDKLAVRPLM